MNGLGHSLKNLNLIFGHSLKKLAIRFFWPFVCLESLCHNLSRTVVLRCEWCFQGWLYDLIKKSLPKGGAIFKLKSKLFTRYWLARSITNESACECELGWRMHPFESYCFDLDECLDNPCQENSSQGSLIFYWAFLRTRGVLSVGKGYRGGLTYVQIYFLIIV